MEKNWVKIYATTQAYKADITQAVLADHDIETILMNKQDSAYISIGEVELYANRENVIKAKHLINEHDL